MNKIVTKAIVLARTDYQEADRILTVLTPDQGKVRLMAKGVRKAKSKMAGGIELFSVNEISFIRGRGELATLVSSRLESHYSELLRVIERAMLGYEILKTVNKTTEDASGGEYFDLLLGAFDGLNNSDIPLELLELWFMLRLLKISGHAPDLYRTNDGKALKQGKLYMFDTESMKFYEHMAGFYDESFIKFMRLGLAINSPRVLCRVENSEKWTNGSYKLAKAALQHYV